MKKLAFLLLCLLNLYGCQKNSNIVPDASVKKDTLSQPGNSAPSTGNTGSFSGTLSPAGAATSISVMAFVNNQSVSLQTTPDANGKFKFEELAAGSYTLYFTPALGYTAPSSKTVTVTNGQNTDAGIISFAAPVASGTITGTVSQPKVITGIVAISAANIYTRYYTLADAATGKFTFPNLPVGTYFIQYVASPFADYFVPTTTGVIVLEKQNTDVGTITVSRSVPGSISGKVTPAGAAASVIAVSESTGAKYTASPDASGLFRISNLPYDKYFVTASPASGTSLYAPYRKPISVSNGQDVVMADIGFTATAPAYPVSFQLDGVNYQTASGLIDSYYYDAKLGINSDLGDYRIIITLANVNGIGDYACNKTSGSVITLSRKTTQTVIGQIYSWSSSGAGSGTVRVNHIDPVAKMISGTFSATLMAGANSTKTITNGTFTIPYQ